MGVFTFMWLRWQIENTGHDVVAQVIGAMLRVQPGGI